MTGPEHYKEAERLLGMAIPYGVESDAERAIRVACAQVHATLAHAAATVAAEGGISVAWQRVVYGEALAEERGAS